MKNSAFLALLLMSATFAPAAMAQATAKVYVVNDDGGEHPQEKCDVKDTVPAKAAKNKKYATNKAYLGSVQTASGETNEAGIDAYDHYFSDSTACETVRKKLNSYSEGE